MKRALLCLASIALAVFNLQAQRSNHDTKSNASSNDVILLISPFDKDTIDDLLPIFNWSMSNAAMNMTVSDGPPQQVQYKFTLVKINKGQTKESAILENQPLFVLTPLDITMLKYPMSATGLEWGNRYAWKIEKFLNGALYNQSEVWEFYIKNPIVKKQVVKLQRNESCDVIPSCNKIDFSFNEEYRKHSMDVCIYDHSGKLIKKAESYFQVAYGENILTLSFDDFTLSASEVYTMSVSSLKGEKYFLRFKIQCQ